jgi:hypothetical protein
MIINGHRIERPENKKRRSTVEQAGHTSTRKYQPQSIFNDAINRVSFVDGDVNQTQDEDGAREVTCPASNPVEMNKTRKRN